MPDLEVIVFNQKIKLSYQDNEKERLINAVETLNKNWNKFSHLHGKVSDIKIITLISLELQDSIEDIQSLKESLDNKKHKINLLQKDIQRKNDEILRTENMLDDIYDELIEIKNNIINKNNE